MEDPAEKSDGASGQGSLFDLPVTKPEPRILPWRSIEIGLHAAAEAVLDDLLALHLELLRRDRRFLTALRRAGVSDKTPGVARFLEAEVDLALNLIALKWDQVRATDVPELIATTRKAEQDLAQARRQILIDLPRAQRDRVMAAEPRIRPKDVELHRDIADLEFRIAEETGQVVTLEVDLQEEAEIPGFLGPADVEALAEAFMRQQLVDEERKPLPVRPRLKTLLKRIPVAWLDAICTHLEVTWEARRRDRELAIADALTDPGTLLRLVQGVAGEEERRLLAYLLTREGVAKASAVTRAYGSDEEDGWFWKDRPPTSTLGRLRLLGLAFVGGRAENARNYRTVVIPEELRETIHRCLKSC